MAVRNCKEIGENLQKIVRRLLANDNLVNLLYYTGADALEKPHLSQDQKEKEVFEKLIKLTPRIGPKETAQSMVVVRVASAMQLDSNPEFKNVLIAIETFVPNTQFFITGNNLRPYAILGEIEESLNGKTINGLGKMQGGDFSFNYVTEEICCYEQTFVITAYD